MSPLGPGSLDLLRCYLAFLPMDQRLEAATISRRWHEATQVHELWRELEVPSELADLVPVLLGLHGAKLHRLGVALHQQHAGRLYDRLGACTSLRELTLQGLRGSEHSSMEASVPTLRQLRLEHEPYFLLGRYRHHSGVGVATVSLAWVARAFPNLEELTCDYLLVRPAPAADAEGAETDADADTDAGAGAEAGASPAASDEPRAAPSVSWRHLSMVAVVPATQGVLWSSCNAAGDLAALGSAAPHLQHLEVRCPRLHLGRMTRRPGQTAEDIARACRGFCATGLAQVSGICRMFPSLTRLEVETLKEDPCVNLEDPDLATFFEVGDGRLLLRAGGQASFLERLQAVAGRSEERLLFEARREQSLRCVDEFFG